MLRGLRHGDSVAYPGSLAIALLLLGAGADAAVTARSGAGFQLHHEVSIAVPPDRVYRALSEVGAWWEPAHTYGGDAANLSLDAMSGGCFCEALPYLDSAR